MNLRGFVTPLSFRPWPPVGLIIVANLTIKVGNATQRHSRYSTAEGHVILISMLVSSRVLNWLARGTCMRLAVCTPPCACRMGDDGVGLETSFSILSIYFRQALFIASHRPSLPASELQKSNSSIAIRLPFWSVQRAACSETIGRVLSSVEIL